MKKEHLHLTHRKVCSGMDPFVCLTTTSYATLLVPVGPGKI
jgi:hypothetical protein